MNGQYEDRRDGFDLIPGTAKVLAILFGIIPLLVCTLIWMINTTRGGVFNMLFPPIIGLVFGGLMAAYVLAAGYVYGDAQRRGMPAGLWTLLVVLIPNCLGFVVYFLVRKNPGHPCPNCGAALAQDALFCSRCGHQLMRPVA